MKSKNAFNTILKSSVPKLRFIAGILFFDSTPNTKLLRGIFRPRGLSSMEMNGKNFMCDMYCIYSAYREFI